MWLFKTRPALGTTICWLFAHKYRNSSSRMIMRHTSCWKRRHLRWGLCTIQSHPRACAHLAEQLATGFEPRKNAYISCLAFLYIPRRRWWQPARNYALASDLSPRLDHNDFVWTWIDHSCTALGCWQSLSFLLERLIHARPLDFLR